MSAKDAKLAKDIHFACLFAPLAFFADSPDVPSSHRDAPESPCPRRTHSSRRTFISHVSSRPWRSLRTARTFHPVIVMPRKAHVREGRKAREGHSFRMSLRALGVLCGQPGRSIQSS